VLASQRPCLQGRANILFQPFNMSDTIGQDKPSGGLDEFEDDYDPDLDIFKSKDRVWLVKVPKWLLDHWSKTDQDNVELARIKLP
jgi:hypothetical protein